MKTKIMKLTLVTLFLISIFFEVKSQTNYNKLDSTFLYNKTTKVQEFTFEVKKGSRKIDIKISGSITEGSLELEFIDPEEMNMAGYNLKCTNSDYNLKIETATRSSNNKKSVITRKSRNVNDSIKEERIDKMNYERNVENIESAKAVLIKEIKNPIPGIWTLKINTYDATGELAPKIKIK